MGLKDNPEDLTGAGGVESEAGCQPFEMARRRMLGN